MALRCRLGDLAVFVRAPDDAPEILGRLVTILRLAPAEDFLLPDGVLHFGVDQPGWWVLQFPRPITAPMKFRRRRTRRTLYAVAPDRALRPIRPDADPADIERNEPVEVTA